MSFRRDGSYVRSERLGQIAKRIASCFSEASAVNLDLLNLWVQMNLGLTEKRAYEYIGTVVKAKGWVLKDGTITTE